MQALRILRRILVAGLLPALLAACGPNASRRANAPGKAPAADIDAPATDTARSNEADTTDTDTPETPATNAASRKKAPHKGLIIVLTDSTLVHGGTDTIRFGRLGSGEIAVLRFRIENATAKPVVLISTQRSCGCISLSHDAQPIAPAQSRTLEMTFDSRGEFGWQLKRMDLFFAGATRPLRLFVEADIE